MRDLIDIGANLTHDSFDADRDEVLSRAAQAGVARMIVTGTTVTASEQAMALASAHPGRLFATAGLHPHHADELDADAAAKLRLLAAEDAIVAVGECGLDFFRDYSPRDTQMRAFEAQLEIAAAIGKPVFLHQRDAHDAFVAVLSDHLTRVSGGVAHCFTGNRDEMRAYLDAGLYIGFTGWICDERRGDSLRDAARYAPLDRVLVETDAPYLLPRDLPEKPSGRRNEPSVLPHIVRTLATYMDQDPDAVANASTANAISLFRLPPG
ncbi:MAG: TatD family hydrolase [Gammaproteobacteria bacterium]